MIDVEQGRHAMRMAMDAESRAHFNRSVLHVIRFVLESGESLDEGTREGLAWLATLQIHNAPQDDAEKPQASPQQGEANG